MLLNRAPFPITLGVGASGRLFRVPTARSAFPYIRDSLHWSRLGNVPPTQIPSSIVAMSMIETSTLDGVPYEVESLACADRFKALCVGPKCGWGCIVDGHLSAANASGGRDH